MELRIDTSDWEDEARQEEADMSTKEAAIKSRIERKLHPAKAARLYIVARELDMADGEMLPPNKLLLMVGGALEWSQMEARLYEEVQLENGKTIRVRSLVHPVPVDQPPEQDDEDAQFEMDLEAGPLAEEPTDDNPAPVAWDDPLAVNRARAYILGKGIGHLYGRFKLIAANGGDLWEVWQEYRDRMEELLAGLA